MKYLGGEPALDRGPDQARRIGPVELVDGDDAGRRGDIDLGQPAAADHINADEQQPKALELRSKRFADFALGIGQLARFGGTAGGEVRADLAGFWPAVDGSR